MGFFSKFEGRMEDTFEGAADRMAKSPISPVQIAKKAEKQMRREKMVGAGKQFAPTLYTVLVNPDDDRRLFGYYPTLAGETETYLAAKAAEQGLVMDGQPLVRFIVDEGLKHGKFDVIAEAVAGPIVGQLRNEEMQRYGLVGAPMGYGMPGAGMPAPGQPGAHPQAYGQAYAPAPAPGYDPEYSPVNGGYDQDNHLPYVPENEIDRSIDYGEYTFDSRDFNEQRDGAVAAAAPAAAAAGMAAAGMAAAPAAAPAVAADTVVFAGGQQAAAPVPSRGAVRARLVDTASNRTYDLASSRLLIGRESKNDIPIQDLNASRTHAELRFDVQGVWVITDLGSTNGTLVNGREIASHPLAEGDLITIGTTNLVFSQA